MTSTLVLTQIQVETQAYWDSVDLRYRVLRKPLGLEFSSEDLATERDHMHLAALQINKVVGILILQPVNNDVVKMRQVAVEPELQNLGIGHRLVNFAESFAAQKDYLKMELNARMVSREFYLSQNYLTDNIIFQEVGINHIKMWKYLPSR